VRARIFRGTSEAVGTVLGQHGYPSDEASSGASLASVWSSSTAASHSPTAVDKDRLDAEQSAKPGPHKETDSNDTSAQQNGGRPQGIDERRPKSVVTLPGEDADLGDARKILRLLWPAGKASMTPRSILMMRIAARQLRGQQSTLHRTWTISTGPCAGMSLDQPLSGQELQRFLKCLDSIWGRRLCEEMSFQNCEVCHALMFVPRDTKSGPDSVVLDVTADPGKLVCCSAKVCLQCECASFDEQLNDGWWTDPETTPLIRCPAEGCTAAPLLHDDTAVAAAIQSFGPDGFDARMKLCVASIYLSTRRRDTDRLSRYTRVVAFRSALTALEPRPTPAARDMARKIHNTLLAQGTMLPLTGRGIHSSGPGGEINSDSPPLGTFRVYGVDTPEGRLDVPFAVDALVRYTVGRDCEICYATILDVEIGSAKDWTAACRDMEGEWMWKLLLFPLKLGLSCEHPIKFCRGCLAQHLKIQLDTLGRSRCDDISCPAEGCFRKLTYDEVQLYADAETLET